MMGLHIWGNTNLGPTAHNEQDQNIYRVSFVNVAQAVIQSAQVNYYDFLVASNTGFTYSHPFFNTNFPTTGCVTTTVPYCSYLTYTASGCTTFFCVCSPGLAIANAANNCTQACLNACAIYSDFNVFKINFTAVAEDGFGTDLICYRFGNLTLFCCSSTSGVALSGFYCMHKLSDNCYDIYCNSTKIFCACPITFTDSIITLSASTNGASANWRNVYMCISCLDVERPYYCTSLIDLKEERNNIISATVKYPVTGSIGCFNYDLYDCSGNIICENLEFNQPVILDSPYRYVRIQLKSSDTDETSNATYCFKGYAVGWI